MKFNEYEIIKTAVEAGIAYGYRRAYKHLASGEHPTEEDFNTQVYNAVMNSLCEVIRWDE